MAKRIFKGILFLLLLAVIAAAGFFAYITLSEYKPAERETLDITGSSNAAIYRGHKLRIATWNIGYGALGETADFFMDGGKSVRTADEEGVKENMKAVADGMNELGADIYFLQEVDRGSSRSCNIDESALLLETFGAAAPAAEGQITGMTASFANNYKAAFVPYPWPPIGKVDSGILTLSRFGMTGAERISLPCPFKWPVRAVNLKRCLMIDRIPIGGTGGLPQYVQGAQQNGSSVQQNGNSADQYGMTTQQELVLINLHLEAYDSGEGKAAQTQMLKQIMDEEYSRGNYVIVGGDFNQTFSNVDSSAYPLMDGMWVPGMIEAKDFGKSWSLLMDETTPTCRSLDKAYKGADKDNFQFYMIDGFIVSKNVKVDKIKTKQFDFKNSDHNPVVLDITLK